MCWSRLGTSLHCIQCKFEATAALPQDKENLFPLPWVTQQQPKCVYSDVNHQFQQHKSRQPWTAAGRLKTGLRSVLVPGYWPALPLITHLPTPKCLLSTFPKPPQVPALAKLILPTHLLPDNTTSCTNLPSLLGGSDLFYGIFATPLSGMRDLYQPKDGLGLHPQYIASLWFHLFFKSGFFLRTPAVYNYNLNIHSASFINSETFWVQF